MDKQASKSELLEAFILGLKLGQVLDCQVDGISDKHLGLLIPATLDGDDKTDHSGCVSFDSLDQGQLSVFFDTLNDRVRYCVAGCEKEASIEASMALDAEWWEAKRAEREKDDHASH